MLEYTHLNTLDSHSDANFLLARTSTCPLELGKEDHVNLAVQLAARSQSLTNRQRIRYRPLPRLTDCDLYGMAGMAVWLPLLAVSRSTALCADGRLVRLSWRSRARGHDPTDQPWHWHAVHHQDPGHRACPLRRKRWKTWISLPCAA